MSFARDLYRECGVRSAAYDRQSVKLHGPAAGAKFYLPVDDGVSTSPDAGRRTPCSLPHLTSGLRHTHRDADTPS